jgi:hypothetical protein
LLVKPAWGIGGGILTLLAVFGERIFPVGKNAAGGIGVLFAARGIGTAVGPIVARRISGEGERRMQASIGIAFLIGGAFYIAFGSATSFIFALVVLGIAHCGGSILWVFSTVVLQRTVVDKFPWPCFRRRVSLADFDYGSIELPDRGTAGSVSHFPTRGDGGNWDLLSDAGLRLVCNATLVGSRERLCE